MQYDIHWLIDQYQNNKSLKYLYFWGHTPKVVGHIDKSCLGQWYLAPFVVDDIYYPTTEHYMMAQKAKLFDDVEIFYQIIHAKHPKQAKDLGRKIGGFDEAIWLTHRFDIVAAGNLAKFNQNPALKTYLLSTGNRILVETSPMDRFGAWAWHKIMKTLITL